jgi:2-methylcitrate dehydratase PrpD
MALGIAGSMAAGSMAYLDDGAWTKRLHPGWACHAGIIAARLAAVGFVGPAAILESPSGFLHAYSSASNISHLERQEDDEFAIMQVSIKPYACCRYMHGPIDCLFEIIDTYHPNLEHIELVRCGVLTGGRGLIADPIDLKKQPKNVVEAQFSMPFGAAIALLTGTAGLPVFTNEWIHNSKVHELMQRIECYSSPELDEFYPSEWRASASVRMIDGREFSAKLRYALGDPHNPLSWEQLEARFHELVAPVIVEERKRKEIIEKVKGLDNLEMIIW